MSTSLWVLFTALFVTLLALPVTLVVLRRRQLFDHPNHRSSHSVPTPRGAGLAQSVGILGAWIVAGGVPALGFGIPLVFSLLGWLDDVRPQRPIFRLMAQVFPSLLAAAVLAYAFPSSAPLVIGLILGSVFLVVMVNATNFMDGINGISLVHGVLFGVVFLIMFWRADMTEWMAVSAALLGVSVAVLPWNWGRVARVFLGDSGSYLLGGAAGVLGVAAWLLGPGFLVAVAPFTIYLADTGATLVRRGWRRESLMTAHRSHIYQRLANGGWSHARTASVVAIFSTCASAVGLLLQFGAVPVTVALLLLLVLASTYLLLPRLVNRWTRQLPSQDSEVEST